MRQIVVLMGLAEVIDFRGRVDEVILDLSLAPLPTSCCRRFLLLKIVDSNLGFVENRSNYFSFPLDFD